MGLRPKPRLMAGSFSTPQHVVQHVSHFPGFRDGLRATQIRRAELPLHLSLGPSPHGQAAVKGSRAPLGAAGALDFDLDAREPTLERCKGAA
jgi:hypothetical protein